MLKADSGVFDVSFHCSFLETLVVHRGTLPNVMAVDGQFVERMDTCICTLESLLCSQHCLLTCHTPIQNEKLKKSCSPGKEGSQVEMGALGS